MHQKVTIKIPSDNHLDDLSTSCKQNDRSLVHAEEHEEEDMSGNAFEQIHSFGSCSKSSSLHSSRSSLSSPSQSSSSRSPSTPSSSYTIPPDGGWGWVVVFASFCCNVIVDGIIFSFGILLLEVSKHFSTSKGTTAWIGSLQAGCYLMIGPVVSALANRYGCRMTTMIGSMIASFGFLISFWATSVLWLAITFGVIGGIGFGFIYLPAIVTVGYYFESKRAFATGIAVCGSGIGAFIMAPLVQYLIQWVGWRGCVLILSGLILNCVVFGSLFRPVEQHVPASQKPLLPKFKKGIVSEDEDDDGAEDRSQATVQETLKSEFGVRRRDLPSYTAAVLSDEAANPGRRSMPDLISVFNSGTTASADDQENEAKTEKNILDQDDDDAGHHRHQELRPRTLTGYYCHPDHNDDCHRQLRLDRSPRVCSQPVVLTGISDFADPDLKQQSGPLTGNRSQVFALNLQLDFNQRIAFPRATDPLIKGDGGLVSVGRENRITALQGVNDQGKHQGSQQKGSKAKNEDGIGGRKAENDPLNESSEEGEEGGEWVQERAGQKKMGRQRVKRRKQKEKKQEQEEDSERISDTKSMKMDMSHDSSSGQQAAAVAVHAAGAGSMPAPDGVRVDDDEEKRSGGAKSRCPDAYDVRKGDGGKKSGVKNEGEEIRSRVKQDVESEVVAIVVTGNKSRSRKRKGRGKKSLLRSLLTDLMDTLDPQLLSSPSFLLLAFSGFLTLAGFFIPFTYIVDRAILQGVSNENSAYLLSVIGITNTVGRVFCGWISDHPKVNALAINNAALVIGGGITLLSPFVCNSFLSLVIYGSVFGFSIACFAALRSVITVELLGLEKLTNAFGLLLLPQGIATIIGTPFAGWLFDVTGSYDSSFYVAGTLITISGLMCLPLRRLSEWETTRNIRLREDHSPV